MNKPGRRISVIVPTFHEAESLPPLIDAIELMAKDSAYDLELLIVDDDSKDGTIEVISQLQKAWVKLITRTANPGLSPSIVEGLDHASCDIVTVMDADLSHPPTCIPQMVAALDSGYDFAIGSRYVDGASTDETWGLLRWINSKVATVLAMPLTSIKDPMSGFFTFKKALLNRCTFLNPVGYKILLELLVKTHTNNVTEIPIHFSNRLKGESKLTFKQQLLYLKHLRRLYLYKYAEGSYLLHFLVVGFIGTFVNLCILSTMLLLGAPPNISVMIAIVVSLISNFVLNRRFTFSYARAKPMKNQFLGYVSASALGAIVNYYITISLIANYEIFGAIPQLAASIGIIAGSGLNYALSRYAVFKKTA